MLQINLKNDVDMSQSLNIVCFGGKSMMKTLKEHYTVLSECGCR